MAQIGAVIGREFSYELLAAVAPMSANLLGDALEQLVNSELVFRRGAPPEATYSFKHALVQDAAYQSLLKSKRRQLHASIAQALEQQFPKIGEAGPEVLAQHLTNAGLTAQAIPYCAAPASQPLRARPTWKRSLTWAKDSSWSGHCRMLRNTSPRSLLSCWRSAAR